MGGIMNAFIAAAQEYPGYTGGVLCVIGILGIAGGLGGLYLAYLFAQSLMSAAMAAAGLCAIGFGAHSLHVGRQVMQYTPVLAA